MTSYIFWFHIKCTTQLLMGYHSSCCQFWCGMHSNNFVSWRGGKVFKIKPQDFLNNAQWVRSAPIGVDNQSCSIEPGRIEEKNWYLVTNTWSNNCMSSSTSCKNHFVWLESCKYLQIIETIKQRKWGEIFYLLSIMNWFKLSFFQVLSTIFWK